MRSGRLEHWVETVSDAAPVEPFCNAAVRAEVKMFKGEAFCRSYLDRCTVEGSTLIVATDYAVGKLSEVREIMKSVGSHRDEAAQLRRQGLESCRLRSVPRIRTPAWSAREKYRIDQNAANQRWIDPKPGAGAT